jgi:hypothetical protein
MEVHQREFVQAVVLAGAMALWMTVWDRGQEPVRADGRPKAESRKDHASAHNAVTPARNTIAQR